MYVSFACVCVHVCICICMCIYACMYVCDTFNHYEIGNDDVYRSLHKQIFSVRPIQYIQLCFSGLTRRLSSSYIPSLDYVAGALTLFIIRI